MRTLEDEFRALGIDRVRHLYAMRDVVYLPEGREMENDERVKEFTQAANKLVRNAESVMRGWRFDFHGLLTAGAPDVQVGNYVDRLGYPAMSLSLQWGQRNVLVGIKVEMNPESPAEPAVTVPVHVFNVHTDPKPVMGGSLLTYLRKLQPRVQLALDQYVAHKGRRGWTQGTGLDHA